MPMLDTFSFVKAYRAAQTDEDRAVALASLVNDAVAAHDNSAATRGDLAAVATNVARVEQRLAAITDDVGGALQAHLGGAAGATAEAHESFAQRVGSEIVRLEQRLELLAGQIHDKAEADKAELKKSIGNVIGWSFVFAALTGLGVWVAVTWPHALEIVQRLRGG